MMTRRRRCCPIRAFALRAYVLGLLDAPARLCTRSVGCACAPTSVSHPVAIWAPKMRIWGPVWRKLPSLYEFRRFVWESV
jgi:hypothetical protein